MTKHIKNLKTAKQVIALTKLISCTTVTLTLGQTYNYGCSTENVLVWKLSKYDIIWRDWTVVVKSRLS